MTFSTKTIMSSVNNSVLIKEDNKINTTDSCLFFEALNLFLNEQRLINSLIAESFIVNNTICEETVVDLFKKAIKNIDIKKIIKSIIKSFKDIIEKIWNKLHAILLDFCNKNRVIKNYRKELENIDFPVYFPTNRYIYTNLGNATSYTTFSNELEKEFSGLILNLVKFRDFKTYESLYTEIENIKNEISLDDNYFNELRGRIIGTRDSVNSSDFASELFKYFRNNGAEIPEGNMTPNEIRMASERYFDYQKTLKQIKKDKDDLKEAANKLEKDIMGINLEDYVKEGITPEVQKMFISVLENKCKRLKWSCEIFLLVFSAKTDAVKESYKQYVKMLMAASKAIVEKGGKS